MTQPKRGSAPAAKTVQGDPVAGTAGAEEPAQATQEAPGGLGALRDAVASRAADGLGVVMLTRDRIQDALDDAVARGHMTREAANGLAETLFARGRQEWQDVFSDVEQLLGRVKDGGRRAVGAGSSFPIEDYDDLTAAQVAERLGDLTPAELRKVRDYEKRHGNRKSVLSAVERKLR